MEKTIALKPKQLAILQAGQLDKQKLEQAFNTVHQRELSVIEVILEEQGITDQISKYELKEKSLVLTIAEEKEKPKAAKKGSPLKKVD